VVHVCLQEFVVMKHKSNLQKCRKNTSASQPIFGGFLEEGARLV
jgi:hypothetical protein